MRPLTLIIIATLFIQTLPTNAAELPKRLIYYSTNLAVDSDADALISLMPRGAKAGFNGIVLADAKFGRLDDMTKHYFQNIDRVKKAAADNKLEIIPCVFPIGYSESLLSHNPNLAEGLPVRDAIYEMHGGLARIVPDPATRFPDGGFADLSKWSSRDPNITPAGDGAIQATHLDAYIGLTLPVHPFHQYHITVKVKTQDLAGEPVVSVVGNNKRRLNYASLGVKPTQDWTTHDVVFNSLDNDKVRIHFECWNGKSGTLEWKDPKLEETGLVNLVRRDGAPLEIHLDNGQPLVEGKDFDPLADPRMGCIPWKGSFEVWHEPPVIHAHLPDGTRLHVSYYHAITVYHGQVMICPSEPETMKLLHDQAYRMHAAWGAKGYFMEHDEIRVLNWDKSCQDKHSTPGAILAENVRACIGILRDVNPGGDIYVWSDMCDPKHNAHDNYYLVNGDLAGSWLGLDKDIIVVPWDFDERADALKWFESLGNRMVLAGYYDAEPLNATQWLDAAKGIKGVEGVMYTTWEKNYSDLEKFGALIK